MEEQKTRFDKLNSKVKNNPVIASLIIFGTIVIALSTFTDAAKSLLELLNIQSRADINGEWVADVTYGGNNTTFVETFKFNGDGEEVYGTASLARLKRVINEGVVKKAEIQFITKTQEIFGEDEMRDIIHRYRGKIEGDEIKFIIQKEGGSSTHVPIEFTAKRVIGSSFDSNE